MGRILPYILGANPDTLVSPFLGGASIELACASEGIEVHGSDAFAPLVNFWQRAIDDAPRIAELANRYLPLPKDKFYSLQQDYDLLDDNWEQAAVFFVLNRSSFSGTTLSGGMSPGHPRFNEPAIKRLCSFSISGLSVTCLDYREAMEEHPDDFLYFDPPYANGEKLYGNRGDMHNGFNHEDLADLLKKRDGWILSYNDTPLIRNLYASYKIDTPSWTYGMSEDKRSKELLILNV